MEAGNGTFKLNLGRRIAPELCDKEREVRRLLRVLK